MEFILNSFSDINFQLRKFDNILGTTVSDIVVQNKYVGIMKNQGKLKNETNKHVRPLYYKLMDLFCSYTQVRILFDKQDSFVIVKELHGLKGKEIPKQFIIKDKDDIKIEMITNHFYDGMHILNINGVSIGQSGYLPEDACYDNFKKALESLLKVYKTVQLDCSGVEYGLRGFIDVDKIKLSC